VEYSDNRRCFPSVSKQKDQHCGGGRCICQSFCSLMQNINPVPQTMSTLTFAKLSWSRDDQFSSLWLGKACSYPDEHTTGFSVVSSQLQLTVMLCPEEAR